ncbi:MAG: YdcF family protein [Alphaproteobacteria bacterium]|nr:YdcF family protein [Alphaproteobacteria bacterium]
MIYYETFLHEMKETRISEEIARGYLEQGILDDIYCKLFCDGEEAKRIRPLIQGIKGFNESLFDEALSNLKIQLNNILVFYENYFMNHPFIGDREAYINPEIVVVLGAARSILSLRIKGAIEYISAFPEAKLVLSGGGFSTRGTEGDFMYEEVRKAELKNEILIERDSMDTLGNALFVRFLLKHENLLSGISRILIVTSRFHILRALYYFRTVFRSSGCTSVAAKGISTINHSLLQQSAHEIMTQHLSVSTLGIFDLPEGALMDEQDMLLKLFQKHKLYQNRYDLLRKYLR